MCSWKEYGAKQKDAQESNRPPKSLGDMEEIYFYGLAHFGLQVAEDYLRHLHQAFDNLSHPQLGRNIDAIGPGLWVLPVANHLIYFRQHRREVNIIRVLHHSHDPLSRSFFS
ncbi:Toxin ParE1 [Serratia marcescens]|uniref:type II toxin-antitoxin system RelE/ParE family toxin n=2 Tax=Serratia TaxID=613 RepID=UPI0007450668|nr:plasmid stabilization protein [Serratia sp. S119]CVB02820.1 Toxin ParE1 [Serratia marcescens]CVB12622.1 Toxin ParE1 [Serratia marcescens]CVB34312.1 Toxin ParE1 [Serratia marcescens]CVB73149.1 Toxin ParE1 [Serratia marcescens]